MLMKETRKSEGNSGSGLRVTPRPSTLPTPEHHFLLLTFFFQNTVRHTIILVEKFIWNEATGTI